MKLGFRVRAGVRSAQKAETLVQVCVLLVEVLLFYCHYFQVMLIEENLMQSVKQMKVDPEGTTRKGKVCQRIVVSSYTLLF